MLANKLLAAMAGGEEKLYVDDVFSAYTYTGNGSTQTITNGIDLAGKGGMVWIKDRDSGLKGHALFDTARGINLKLQSQSTNGQFSGANQLTAFNSNGFALGSSGDPNGSGTAYVSWTFRKAAKFFDVVTYTGNGGTKVVPHSIGSAPGMIVVKRTDTTGDWVVYHQSVPANCGFLNLTNSFASAQRFSSVTSSDFTINVSTADVNASGGTYVAYLFAHDTGTDGLIQCGSFTTDGSGNATVTLGWEPQFNWMKSTDLVDQWYMLDSMRGWPVTTASTKILAPNTSGAETTGTFGNPTATGFTVANGGATKTYVYCAVRRPNKPPTTGTQVYNAIARTGTGAVATVTGVGFAPDLVCVKARSVPYGNRWTDRMWGAGWALTPEDTTAQLDNTTIGVIGLDVMDGARYGAGNPYNNTPETYINHFFKRAPGVFDVVCRTGTSAANTAVAHSLQAAPEFIIAKIRSAAGYDWWCYHSALGQDATIALNLTTGVQSSTAYWGSSAHSSSTFYVGNNNANKSPETLVYYLWATKAGISKVGSYTGNGSSQTIDCGFTTGARFFLCKRTDSTGDWYVFDTTRGIIAGNDGHLSLNTTAAEVTTDDSVDPDTSGFIVNQLAATNINVNAASYIFLAFA